jgi:hypothetical protein
VGGEALIVEDEEVLKFNQGDKLHGKSLAGQEVQRSSRRIVGVIRARESVFGGEGALIFGFWVWGDVRL